MRGAMHMYISRWMPNYALVLKCPVHHLRKVLLRKRLRIEAMCRTMLLHQIVCQLMAESDPPVRNRLNLLVAGCFKIWEMKLLKIVIIEEQGTIRVECNGAVVGVVENM